MVREENFKSLILDLYINLCLSAKSAFLFISELLRTTGSGLLATDPESWVILGEVMESISKTQRL